MIQLLTALSLALSCAGPGQDSTVRWMPTWHTGDTWVVKELVGPPQMWQYETYKVLGTKHVGESDCYILEIQHGSLLASRPRARTIYDVRVRDLKMIRRIDFYVFSGKLQPPKQPNTAKVRPAHNSGSSRSAGRGSRWTASLRETQYSRSTGSVTRARRSAR